MATQSQRAELVIEKLTSKWDAAEAGLTKARKNIGESEYNGSPTTVRQHEIDALIEASAEAEVYLHLKQVFEHYGDLEGGVVDVCVQLQLHALKQVLFGKNPADLHDAKHFAWVSALATITSDGYHTF